MSVLDLAAVPSGTHIFVDTNIFQYHYTGQSITCTAFVTRMTQGDITAYVNTLVLGDLLHQLMVAEAYQKSYITQQAPSKLKKHLATHRATAAALTDSQRQLENTVAIGLKVLGITRSLLVRSKAERVAHGLMTNDSLHLANMNRTRPPIVHIATRDGDFAHIPGITVWAPMDLPIPPAVGPVPSSTN